MCKEQQILVLNLSLTYETNVMEEYKCFSTFMIYNYMAQ